MSSLLTAEDIFDVTEVMHEFASDPAGRYQSIRVADHGAAILVVHQMSDDAKEDRPSPQCEAYTKLLLLQSELASLMHSYNPELPMGPGMRTQFETIRDQLDQVYKEIRK